MEKKIEMKISALEWLLEPEDIGVKYLAMRDLLETAPEELLAVKNSANTEEIGRAHV